VLALVCVVPRLVVLLHERGAILAGGVEKSDIFAQTFVRHGTFGFISGEPSAYTQPLYGWVLIPVYWIFGRSWESIGIAQLVLAAATVGLVYEIGRRILSRRAALAAAALATLNPYLVWHDMHVNREIVDQVCAAALVLLTLALVERPTRRRALLLGVVSGLALLGNSRLVFVPVLCALYVLWRLPRTRMAVGIAALVLAGAAVTVSPWIVRNKVQLGCWAVTTDGRALWKANNPQTYGLLSSGQWIDNVQHAPRPAGARYTPEEIWGFFANNPGREAFARSHYPNECILMTYFEHRTISFWKQHPGEKAKLMALSLQLLWQPSVIETSGGGSTSATDVGRRVIEPVYMVLVYALAAIGVFLVPRAFAALALLLLAYQSACAAVFVGATRYRVAWDFLVVLLATAALERGARLVRSRKRM
jgi:4-amino-4-deoxy-L-arabinose transferase-like glycosyltransferase